MSTLTLDLADSEAEFLARRAAAGGFASAEAYLHSLIADAEREEARARLEAQLLEGLEGPWEVITDDYWIDLKRRVRERRDPEAAT